MSVIIKTLKAFNRKLDAISVGGAVFFTKRKWVKIVARKTTKSLSKEQKAQCKNFYKPYFKLNTCFHTFYTEKTGLYDSRYIPDDIYYGKIDRFFNNYKMAAVLDNKCFYPRMFGNICKQAENVAYRLNGYWYNRDMAPVSELTIMTELNSFDELVVKLATDSFGGHGVEFIKGTDKTINEQLHKLVTQHSNDIVIQLPIQQHSKMAELHQESINTIRVLSFLSKEGEVKIYSVIVRMGVGTARVDNASSGGITCGVEQDGTLKKCAYSPNGTCFEKHPTTGVCFDQICIPGYQSVLDSVKKMHSLIPHFRIASWDMAVDQEGEAVLIEVNLRAGELDFHQLNNGPLFGDDTKNILDEVFGN